MFPAGPPGAELSLSVVLTAAAVSAAFILIVLAALLRSSRRAVVAGAEALIGAEGDVVSWQDGEGRVRVMSEIWRARAGFQFLSGARVKVIDRDGLTVVVEPASRPSRQG
jgi:membrane-bound serine protease (ClpP class)